MRGLDAATISSKDRAVIKALERIDKGARAGVSRDIFTLAHELGHVVYCHPREALARVTNATRSTPASPTVKRYEAEANNFASFFLVKDEFAQDCKTPSELCRRFGVSFSFAENWLRDRERTRERPRVIEGFEKLLRDLNGKSDPTGVSFPQASNGPEPLIGGVPSSLPCYCTGGWLVSTCGGKYKCTNCQRVVELPDGDSFGSQSNP